MANIKEMSKIVDKWQRRASVATPDYQDGIENPKRDWAEAASAANNNYVQGVTRAAQEGRFAAGVKRVGTEKWKKRALAKGPNRFTEGVSIATPDYEAGFAPYREAISALKLPDRGPKGDPRNIQRVAAVATTLRKLKEKAGK